jgi:hypothetical protein
VGKKLDPIPVRLDPDVRAALEKAAKADGRSLSNYINQVLKEYFLRKERGS